LHQPQVNIFAFFFPLPPSSGYMVRLQAQLLFLLVLFFLHQTEAASSCTKLRFSFLLILFFLHKAELEFFFLFFFLLQQAEATRFGSKLSFSSSFYFIFLIRSSGCAL
jgi:hypothetical protein